LNCRHCDSPLTLELVDLGSAPPSNAYVPVNCLNSPEEWFPLRVFVCQKCWLAQTADYVRPEQLFTKDYAYFSSTSSTWLHHVKKFAAEIIRRLDLNEAKVVVEIATNDGCLLERFHNRGIPCYGIEPTRSTAEVARSKGLVIEQEFFDLELARRLVAGGQAADLVIANNVLAHVPDINDFLNGVRWLLSETGVATFEFPSLLELIRNNQFDTVYHEHYSYISLTALRTICEQAGLAIFDVTKIPTHGGSFRVYTQPIGSAFHGVTENVQKILTEERVAGVKEEPFYTKFQATVEKVKLDFLEFLIGARRAGMRVAGYGAAAKGNTLLNYCGVKADLVPLVCDAAEAKQGNYLPGSRIPIVSPQYLVEYKPDYILVFPWNIFPEVKKQVRHIVGSDCRLVTVIPKLRIYD
jgi:2-polyprenyl-3-methyl-5-hydroxy-6-metoxy-1,4-benzoquinol methylase